MKKVIEDKQNFYIDTIINPSIANKLKELK